MSLVIGLVGNPNCGKTTIFNKLTGLRQTVGNWPGVTVEKKSGFFVSENLCHPESFEKNYHPFNLRKKAGCLKACWHDTLALFGVGIKAGMHDTRLAEVIDLPGVYSLTVAHESSIDEKIACEYILSRQANVIVNILDASNLERHLYLTMQLLQMRVPMVIAVNMMDVAKQRGIEVSLEKLEKELDCAVVGLDARRGKGITELKDACLRAGREGSINKNSLSLVPDGVKEAVDEIQREITSTPHLSHKERGEQFAIGLLEDDAFARAKASPELLNKVSELQHHIRSELNEDADILFADARYRAIGKIISNVIVKTKPKTTWTTRIDRIVLNRILGIPIFLCVMYLMFLFAINIGGAFQDFFDIGSDTLFVQGFSHLLTTMGIPTWVIALLANGIGKGINTTITFIPVIGAMFLCLAFLEDSGYMARGAFVIDRGMRALGLPGKSFVPMIVGFGCNVPSVMAARTLENKRDRILTIMMSPFMSCGARLAIYAVFVAAFFPKGGHNIVFGLYLIGILMAVFTGFLLRKTILKGNSAPLLMELPAYHLPRFDTIFLHTWQRLKSFIFRAGKLIVPICVLIGVLNSLSMDGSINSGEGDTHSILATVGMWLTPIFAPMGIEQHNWPATVGLVTGVLAKEVVVGTLNTLYSQLGNLTSAPDAAFSVWGGLQDAFASIPKNFAELGSAFSNPVLAKAPVHTLSQGVYGIMAQHFDGQIGAMAYLLFVLLYFPCVSTTAVIIRELNRRWALFSVLWSTGVAYGVAVIFYQVATFLRHPVSSSLWLMAAVGCMLLTSLLMQRRQHGFA